MKPQIDKTQEPQNSITPRVASESSNGGTAQLMDNRTSSLEQRKLQTGMNGTYDSMKPIQRKNNTGLPDNLKSGIENLSGYSMDDVKVHYNSSKPAQLQAHAYAQGTDIHLAPGQEKHLPHEAWHVVQQKQGRVQPTRQLKSKVNINDDAGLEKEADVMGAKAMQMKSFGINNETLKTGIYLQTGSIQKVSKGDVIQREAKKVKGRRFFGKTPVFSNHTGRMMSVGTVAKNTILEVDMNNRLRNVRTNHGKKDNMYGVSRLSASKLIFNNNINKATVEDSLFISGKELSVANDYEQTTVDTLNSISAANNDMSYGELEFRLGYDADTFITMTNLQGLTLQNVGANIIAGRQEGLCGQTSGIIAEWHGVDPNNWAATPQLNRGNLDGNEFTTFLNYIKNAPSGSNLRINVGCHSFTVEVIPNGKAVISQSYIGAFGLSASMAGESPRIYGAVNPTNTKKLNRVVKLSNIGKELKRIVNNAQEDDNPITSAQRTDLDSPGALLSTPLSANIQLNRYQRDTPANLRAAFIAKLNDPVEKPKWDRFFPNNIVAAYV